MTPIVDRERARPQDRLGTVLKNRWRLDAVLGVGGMAVVYSATAPDGSRVALKVLDPELSRVPDIRSRFLREGFIANAIGHPGVVRIHDRDEEPGGAVFLVMELLDGEPLDAAARRAGDRLPPLDVFRLADQVLDVLAAAHARGIIHRDIKPQNLFLTRTSDIKVLDFGIARILHVPGPLRMTQAGAVLGTIAYMAPEQASGCGQLIDARTDLFALGATMFRLLTGQLVHQVASELALWEAAASRPARSIATVLPGLPAPAASLIDRALLFEQQHRWPDARSMQETLRAVLPLLEQCRDATVSAFTPADARLTSADQPTVPASRRPPIAAHPDHHATGQLTPPKAMPR